MHGTDLGADAGVKLPGEAEVDDLDLVAVGRDAENVLGLQVEVQDVLLVHVLDTCNSTTCMYSILATAPRACTRYL